MRVIVRVLNDGRLRSGHENATPARASSRANGCAFDESGDDANPCRYTAWRTGLGDARSLLYCVGPFLTEAILCCSLVRASSPVSPLPPWPRQRSLPFPRCPPSVRAEAAP